MRVEGERGADAVAVHQHEAGRVDEAELVELLLVEEEEGEPGSPA
jgi:hypothetical protein